MQRVRSQLVESTEDLYSKQGRILGLTSDLEGLCSYVSDLMTTIPHPVYVVNPAGIIIDANPALEYLTGWPLEDLLGKRHHTIFSEEDLIDEVEKELIENGYLYGKELVLLNKYGEKSPVHLFARSRKDDLENASYIATLIDATERKKAEEQLRQSEERYRLLAENAADVIWTVDVNNRLTYISPSVTRLLGYSVEEAMAKTMEEIFTPSSFEVAMKALEEELAIENTENKDFSRSRTFEQELIRKDGP
jgi:PAS domain S-box-containing protein